MKSKSTYYLNCLIGIFIMIVFCFIPPFGPVTETGVKVLGVFMAQPSWSHYVRLYWV